MGPALGPFAEQAIRRRSRAAAGVSASASAGVGGNITTHARTWSLRLWDDSPQAHLLIALRQALVELAALLRQPQAAPG